MSRILILLDSNGNHLDWFVNLFNSLDYKKNIDNNFTIKSSVLNYLHERYDCSDVIQNQWNYSLKNDDIVIRFGNPKKMENHGYDKKIFITNTLTRNSHEWYTDYSDIDYDIIFFHYDESSDYCYEELKKICEKYKIKVITTSLDMDMEYSDNHVFYNPYLSMITAYYYTNYNWLNFEQIITKKETLIGTYYRNGHRTERDLMFEELQKYCTNRKQSIKVHNYLFDDMDEIKKLQFFKQIYKSRGFHTSTFTDYLKSVVTLYFETHMETNDISFLSEKSMKSILFSGVGIIPIVINNRRSQRILKNDGFFLYNLEEYDESYFDGNEIKFGINTTKKSINRLIDTYLNKGKKSYQQTYEYMLNDYQNRLNSNITKLFEIFSKLENNINLIEFIIQNHE